MRSAKKTNPVPVYYTVDLCHKSPIGSGMYAVPVSGNTYSPGGGIESSFFGRCRIVDAAGEGEIETCVLKSAKGFGNNPELAYRALYEWKKMGFSGSPFSASSFVREMFIKKKRDGSMYSKSTFSAGVGLRESFTGGWIEARKRGYIKTPLWHYDVNSAYMHAAAQGLPSKMLPYRAGRDCMGYIVNCTIEGATENLPNYLTRRDRYLVTSQEVQRYGLRISDPIGIMYEDLDVNMLDVLYELADLSPDLFKRCTQAFWGFFASFSGIDVASTNGLVETKTEWKLYNRFQNVSWAALIVRRVALQVYEKMCLGGISCYVDSVLLPFEIEIGENTGQWKLEHHFPKGVFLESPGVYDSLPLKNHNRSSWYKHSGYK